MLTSRSRPPLFQRLVNASRSKERWYLHNRQDLEEVVLREIFVRVVRMKLYIMLVPSQKSGSTCRLWCSRRWDATWSAYRPEVVHEQIEHT